MGNKHELKDFWTSLITENGISPHVESLMKITDTEEKSLALMSRVFFLYCMGIKYQREDLEHTFNLIRTVLNKSSVTKASCLKCSEIKTLLEKTDFVKVQESLNDCTNISSRRRNLSDSPPQLLKKLCSRDKENVDSSPENTPSIEILVPETQPFLQVKENVNKEFIIPETVPNDDRLYGNTDFFNTFQDPDEKSPVSNKCNTSPILGKMYKPSNPPASVQSKASFSEPTNSKSDVTSASSEVRGRSSDKVFNSPDSVNNSPSLLGCNIINQIPILTHSTSSLKERKNIPIPLAKNIYNEGKPLTPSKSKFKTSLHPEGTKACIQPEVAKTNLQPEGAKDSFNINRTLRSTPSHNPLMKCKSEMGMILSNRGRLSRLKTLTSQKDEKSKLEVSFEPKEKKIYKQTTITLDSFLKHTNIAKRTGGKSDLVNIDEDEDDDDKAIEKAIEASLHSKEIEDLLRKKRKEIDESLKGSLKKKKLDKSPTETSIRKSPRTKCQKSLKFGSPSKGSSSKISEEEVLADLENIQAVKDKEEDVHSKLRKIKKNVLENSFDVLPTKDKEPNYAYKGNVARKNSEKQRLDGWNCHECRDYYESKDLTEEQRKVLQNKCSRHRSKYRPLTNTPEGFWDVGWSDEEET